MRKPYLLSVGIGIPLFGVWMHRYFRVKKSRKLRYLHFLGIKVIWTTYKRKEVEE